MAWTATTKTAAQMQGLCRQWSCGYDGDENNNQLKAEIVVVVMATATATAGVGSNNDNSAAPDAKEAGAEVINVEGEDEDCGADAGVFVDSGHVAATAMKTTIN